MERKAGKAKRAYARAEFAALQAEHQQSLDPVAAYAKVPLPPDRVQRLQDLLASDFGGLDGTRQLGREGCSQ